MSALPPDSPDLVTRLMAAADGDPSVAEDLLPLVYEQLRRSAQANLVFECKDRSLAWEHSEV